MRRIRLALRTKGRGVATFGDASMFSFHATKVFHTIEGGAVCFNGEQNGLKEDLYGLKNFGIRNEVVVDAVGANSKMNEFQAAMGLLQPAASGWRDREAQPRGGALQRTFKRCAGNQAGTAAEGCKSRTMRISRWCSMRQCSDTAGMIFMRC